MHLEVGMPAPDFTLPLGTGGTISLANMRGKPVVLYFYPKDDTPGCTTEACGFRDALPRFGTLDAAVIGISKDSPQSHREFAKKYELNFHLASDENSNTAESYGVWVHKNNYGKSYMGIERTTFLIDEKGIIRAIWKRVSVEGHVAEVYKAVEALRIGMPYAFPGAKPPPPPPPPPKPVKVKAAPPPKAVKKAAPKKAPKKAVKKKPAPKKKPVKKKAAPKKAVKKKKS